MPGKSLDGLRDKHGQFVSNGRAMVSRYAEIEALGR